jgi:glycosyltransferase involved in cell wall biosynthesis
MVKRIVKKMSGLFVRRIFPKLRDCNVPSVRVHPEPTEYLVTTWNTRCGIAVYSAFLAAELKRIAKIRVVSVTDNHTLSPYFFVLGFTTGRSNNIVHVQFAYSMFARLKLGRRWGLSDFTALLFYLGLAFGRSLVITTFHEVPKTMSAGGRIRLVYTKLLNRLICDVSNLIIVHTSESKKLMVKNYRVNRSKLKVIPMGCVETPQFLNKEACKKKLNLSGKTVITIPGFVSKNHGHDLVVSILPLLDKDVHLLIAGGARTKETAAYYEELRKMAQRYHCTERITFVDDFPITSTAINATNIAILPYRYATESLTLRLLAAYKVPTITSDLSVFKEVKKEYDCIELFRRDDKEDLLAKILSLLSDERKQSLLQEQCRKLWNDNKWSSIAAKHAETYLEVLSGHPDSIYDDKKQKERIDWLKENVSGNALEIGCAGGFVTSYTSADVGLDMNQWRIKFAKTKHPEKDFITASAFSLPFKEKAFDTILIPEILEHVPITQTEKIISEAKRVANKMLITLPNADKINYNKSLVENPEHKWFPTKKIVLKLIENCKIQYTSENDFILVYGT